MSCGVGGSRFDVIIMLMAQVRIHTHTNAREGGEGDGEESHRKQAQSDRENQSPNVLLKIFINRKFKSIGRKQKYCAHSFPLESDVIYNLA